MKVANVTTESTTPSAFPVMGWLFPGQGSQHVGMGQALAEAFPVALEALREADDVLGFHLSRLCFEGPEDELTDTVNAQPALMACGVAALYALRELLGEDASPAMAAGHSMGEYTALVAAGSLTYADGLRLVRTRGRLMKQAGERTPGMMAAILGLETARVAEICAEATATGGIAQVANDNCPGQVVISGDRTGMEAAMAALSGAGAKKVVPLAVSIAAHSPLMRPAAEELRAAIEATPLRTPHLPVYGNTSAQPMTSVESIRDELSAQLTGNVRWTESVQAMVAAGARAFVEIGPGEVLTGLVKRIDRSAGRYSVRDPESLRAFVEAYGAPDGGA